MKLQQYHKIIDSKQNFERISMHENILHKWSNLQCNSFQMINGCYNRRIKTKVMYQIQE